MKRKHYQIVLIAIALLGHVPYLVADKVNSDTFKDFGLRYIFPVDHTSETCWSVLINIPKNYECLQPESVN